MASVHWPVATSHESSSSRWETLTIQSSSQSLSVLFRPSSRDTLGSQRSTPRYVASAVVEHCDANHVPRLRLRLQLLPSLSLMLSLNQHTCPQNDFTLHSSSRPPSEQLERRPGSNRDKLDPSAFHPSSTRGSRLPSQRLVGGFGTFYRR